MSNVLVRVIEEDYTTAECYSERNCVLAKAIHRATKDSNWRVDGDAVRNYEKDVYAHAPEWFDTLAQWADDWLDVKDADNITAAYADLIEFKFDTKTGVASNYRWYGEIPIGQIWEARFKAGLIESFKIFSEEEEEEECEL